MGKYTILQIIRGLDIGNDSGGAERFGVELSRALTRAGHKVFLCAFFTVGTKNEQAWQTKLMNEGINVFFLVEYQGTNNLRQYLRAVQLLLRKLRGIKIDVTHSHFQLGSLTGLILRVLKKTRIALRTAHIRKEWESGWVLLHVFIEWLFPYILDVEVGVSQDIVNNLASHPGSKYAGHPPVLIHNAVSFQDKADPALAPEKLKHSADERSVISVGRLTEQKGYEYLLDAIPTVAQRIPQVKFYFIGDGDLHDALVNQAKSLGVDGLVTFMGVRSDVPYLLSQSDLFVLPSLWEGFPTVIMESMVSETTVIATDIPGTRELVINDRNGWLIPPRDSIHMAELIIFALEHEAELKRVKEQAKKDVRQFFIYEICQNYLALYDSLLEK